MKLPPFEDIIFVGAIIVAVCSFLTIPIAMSVCLVHVGLGLYNFLSG